MNQTDKASKDEERQPTTLIDCPNCEPDDDECFLCNGSGSVWLDQFGKPIKNSRSYLWDDQRSPKP